ncbi:MAG: phosphoribosylformylglycinamidine cyclo-ligase [Acidobacteria bacterium]|jgi:phosphoribosylformylglycinamidine cyclo-ligase|nr:phosphoribosylformylglycinamidine cyclo-ligase [Acidobacteriota bacterium]
MAETGNQSKYAQAGVNIDKGNQAVKKIKDMVRRMGVKEIGKFSGFFPLKEKLESPVLVSSADGVGTKLKIAFLTNKHNTVGKDLVNHCVNDILVYGAKPLFFLDYIATGKVEPDNISEVVSGILDGCLENDFILLGGETAEMPGFYQENEYDVAGFIVGILENKKIVDGKNIKKGDLVIGLPSSGLHTNGYSLARHIIFDELKLNVNSKVPELSETIGEELLKVHRSYLKPVSQLIEQDLLKGMAHLTGGGFIDNIPRVLPDDVSVQIERTWPVPGIFTFLCEKGNVSIEERYRVFNMGIGMVLFIDKSQLSKVEDILKSMNEKYYLIGQVVNKKGNNRVIIN